MKIKKITVGTKSHDTTLSDLNISNKQSSCWQAILKAGAGVKAPAFFFLKVGI